jgi:hypothetical protein
MNDFFWDWELEYIGEEIFKYRKVEDLCSSSKSEIE